jgi:hypothetical protein
VSPILVLLVLLSVATLAARRGFFAFVTRVVATPLLLAAGVLISPRALAFLTPSTLDALEPALRVAVAWLALLVGMRGVPPKVSFLFARDTVIATGTGVASWLVLAAVAGGSVLLAGQLGLEFFGAATSTSTLVGMALLLGGIAGATGLDFAREAIQGATPTKITRRILFLARHDELLAAIGLCLAVWLLPLTPAEAPVYATPLAAAGVVVMLGVALAAAQLLAGGSRMGGPSATIIAMVGLSTFGAGLSFSTYLPGAAVAFFFGGGLAIAGIGQSRIANVLSQSERPVRLVVLVLAGAHLGLHPAAIVVGASLALARIPVKLAARAVFGGARRRESPPNSLLGAASAAIPFALSWALTRPEPLQQSAVLTCIATCVALTDAATLIAWRKKSGDEPTASATAREVTA